MEDVKYSLVSANYHNWISNNTGHYLCDILEFDPGIWWRCDDDTITHLRGMTDNFYSVAPYLISGKKSKKL